MDEKEKQRLEEFVEMLSQYKGRHTELVSVYIPAGQNIYTVAKQIEDEVGTATNIKSAQTRKNVIEALEKISRFFKTLKKTPENGLAIFAGNISDKEGQINVELFYIEPPQLISMRLYRCDKEFVLEPLKEMLEVKEVYGLVVMDRKEATIGLLEGKKIKVLSKLTSGVPGKIKAGGQSAARFHRITEGLAKDFFRRIADEMKKIFFNMPKLKGILVGGPIPTKEDFLDEGQLVTQLKEKVIAVKDIGYSDEHGLELLLEQSQDALAKQEIMHEKNLLEDFFDSLAKTPEKTAYGLSPVKKALKYGAVETLILSKKIKKEFKQELIPMAEQISANVEIVSVETPEGEQFYNLSGIGAILRFRIG